MLTQDLKDFLNGLEAESAIFEPEQLRERLIALDDLDAGFGSFDSQPVTNDTNMRMFARAQAIRVRLEASNAKLYQSIRYEIRRNGHSRLLLRCLRVLESHTASPPPSLAYDCCDDVVSGILQLREPNGVKLPPAPDTVLYQPTPARHILRLINATRLCESDIFFDLGSGLGHVPLLASMLTGARCYGIEIEPDYVASAQECALHLQLGHAQFIRDDVRKADLSTGSVFYLYSPFRGSILAEMLHKLREVSKRRPIRICTLGPCTHIVAEEPWLRSAARPDPGPIVVFQSDL